MTWGSVNWSTLSRTIGTGATPEDKYEAGVVGCREVLAQHNLKLPLWQGESGCPSQTAGAGALAKYPWTEARQARWVVRRTLNDLRLQVDMTSYFHAVDMLYPNDDGTPDGRLNSKGLIRRSNYTPKPAYFAYQCLCALFDARRNGPSDRFKFRLPTACRWINRIAESGFRPPRQTVTRLLAARRFAKRTAPADRRSDDSRNVGRRARHTRSDRPPRSHGASAVAGEAIRSGLEDPRSAVERLSVDRHRPFHGAVDVLIAEERGQDSFLTPKH